MLFDAQNAGNHISKLLGERGLAASLVVTAAYYTFKGRLQLKLLKALLTQ